jgi:bis(5'-adenosyl)-triphosphatase
MLKFGAFAIQASEVFYLTPLSMGLVNLKPVVPGHVLLIPRRVVKRFTELTSDEVTDLFQSAARVAPLIEREFGGQSLTLTIQDGAMAGQTVEHVHLHIIPRRKGDYFDNDDIYPDINLREKQMAAGLADFEEVPACDLKTKANGPDAALDRQPRSRLEMAEEASRLRLLFPECKASYEAL